MKSNKTLEEAIAFFETDMKKQTPVKTTSRRGRKKKTT